MMVSKQRSALRYQSGLWMGSFQSRKPDKMCASTGDCGVEGSNCVGNERGQAPRCFIPLCVVRFGSKQIGREGRAASSGVIGPGFVERTVAMLANTGVLSITIALLNVIIAIATTIIIVVIIIIIIILALDLRQRQVDEYPLLLRRCLEGVLQRRRLLLGNRIRLHCCCCLGLDQCINCIVGYLF